MSKLLKGKRVFLDTQIFRQARFGVASPAFKKLAEICKHGDVILVTTSLTRREIEAQIDEAAPDFKKTLGRAAVLLSGLGHSEPTIDSVPAAKMTEPEIAAYVKRIVAEFFHDCGAEEIVKGSVLELWQSWLAQVEGKTGAKGTGPCAKHCSRPRPDRTPQNEQLSQF